MCVPRPDSPSIFSALLDRSAGSFRLGPYDEMVPAARRYLPGSLMVETTWQTRTGWLIVRDALCMGPWHNLSERSKTHRRSPTDYDAEHCLLRTVRCVSGAVDLSMTCDPMFDYARIEPEWTYEGDGYGQVVAGGDGTTVKLRITTDLRPGIERRGLNARTRMVEGDCHFVALSWSPLPAPMTYDDAQERMHRTSEHWRQWITQGDFPDHRWRSYLQRSALTLKGLTYAPTGALLAAPPPACPRRRRASATGTTATPGSATPPSPCGGSTPWASTGRPTTSSISSPTPAATGRPSRSCTAWAGSASSTEESLPHLSGYEGAWPVRIGNAAYKQQQHDVWGAVLDSVLLHARSRAQLQESFWPVLKRQVECAAEHWEEPDRGIWEVRGEPQHFTSSKFMCWVALDRGARLARMYDEPMYADKWQALADQIHADICNNGVDQRGVFVQRYGSDALDASLLLLPLLRFLPPEDPRIRATVLAIADELTHEGLVLRYRVERDRRRAGRRRGYVHHLLLLAGLGPDRDRRDRAGPPAVRAPAVVRQPPRAVRRGARSPHRPAPRQLPAGLHPPGAGQRGGARHPGRGGGHGAVHRARRQRGLRPQRHSRAY